MSKLIVSHSHIVTRASMKQAHNLDDRQERAAIHDEKEDVDKAALVAMTAKRFTNLSAWLNKYEQDKKAGK